MGEQSGGKEEGSALPRNDEERYTACPVCGRPVKGYRKRGEEYEIEHDDQVMCYSAVAPKVMDKETSVESGQL
jgi:hypothetical protein